MASTRTVLAGVPLSSCIFNAAGPRDVTLEELRVIAASASGATVMKSCTLEPREGNPEPRYCDLDLGSINSMGLPNFGYEAYVGFAALLKIETPKPIIASIAGLKPDDFPTMVAAFHKSDVDLLEVNLSCPNVPGKPQIGYDFEGMDAILTQIATLGPKPFGVKLPPYFDFVHFEQAAAILKKHPVAFITCVNSIGNALVIDPETQAPVIKPKGGFGGLGGKYLKPTALANVRKFRELLGDDIGIVGAGGVYDGTDAFEFLLAGADAVQVGTCFMQEGVGCFARIDTELAAILERKGYAEPAAARGKLRNL